MTRKTEIIIFLFLSLHAIGICDGATQEGLSPLLFNESAMYRVSGFSLSDSVYPVSDFRLPADNEGRIDTIMLRNKKKDYILNLIRAVSSHVKIVVFLEREEIRGFGEKLFEFLKRHNMPSDRMGNIILLPLDSKQPLWMRDNGILFVNRKDNLITFVPCRSRNEKEVFLNEYVQSSMSDNIVRNDSDFRFNFPGGEIVASESYMFCKKTRLFDDDGYVADRTAAIKKIEELCKKKLIDLGMIEAPVSHIDLWLTPIDDKTILLGDVLLGNKIMGEIPGSERLKIVDRYIKKERLAGFKLKKTKRKKDYRRDYYSMLFGKNRNPSDGISINNVKRHLEERGFKVVVIPSIGQLEIHRDSYYSYNNVLMESYEDENGMIIKNVIVPEYGHPLDNIARQVWESLGFQVRQFIMNDIARKGGAIRCSSQRVPGCVRYEKDSGETVSLHHSVW